MVNQRLQLEVEVLELETAVAMLAAGIPPNARRAPFPHELRAPVNFATVQDRLDQGASDIHGQLVRARHDLMGLLAAWLLLGDPSPADVVRKLNLAVLGGRLPPGVRDVIDRTQKFAAQRLQQVADGALSDTQQEAEHQGVPWGKADAALIAAAVSAQAARLAVAPWLSALAAMRAAAQREPLQPNMTADRLVQLLTQAAAAASLAGLMNDARQGTHVAQGTARTAGLKSWEPGPDQPVVAYASELLDTNTCKPCSDVDGKKYYSLDEAYVDYPGGQYAACRGGPNCRGMLVQLVKH
jgi:hypothetical protein